MAYFQEAKVETYEDVQHAPKEQMLAIVRIKWSFLLKFKPTHLTKTAFMCLQFLQLPST